MFEKITVVLFLSVFAIAIENIVLFKADMFFIAHRVVIFLDILRIVTTLI